MTRKDYVAIAAAIKDAAMGYDVGDKREEGVNRAALAIADVMAHDNPRFDRERFLKACGVQS